MRKNIYTHEIELTSLKIINRPRNEFRKLLEKIKYRAYEVEQIRDGRKVVITKPGGKFTYGRIRREDFMVWVYNPSDSSLWLISHKDIYNDIQAKGKVNPEETVKIIDALERVFNGEEPEYVLKEKTLENPCGQQPEVLLKVYKWIWGQENCNYPEGEGRNMSMKYIRDLREKLKAANSNNLNKL